MAIPKGKVATYGQIALLCGKPKNSRQVGYGLKKNLAGEDVPAYRVVNGKGELSGACHFEFPGLQKLLLEEENIESRYVWKPMHLQPYYERYNFFNNNDENEISVAEDIFNRGICLPSDTKMTEEELERVITIIKKLFR